MTLIEFIDDKIAIAKEYRGLSKLNPVEIIVEGGGKSFVVLVSMIEPDTLTVPYNVCWINADEDSEDYKVLMRRVDAENYDGKGYRGSWAVLSTVEEIYNEEQYFKKESDPILGEVEQFRPALANDTVYGGFFTSHDDTQDTADGTRIVVGSNDTRMSNARPPKPHSHADFPRTMLSTGDGSENYINISSVNDPVAGQVLFVESVDEQGNCLARWDWPDAEFPYVGPLPVDITVIGPINPVNALTNHILRADVTFDDNSKVFSAKVIWSIQEGGEAASINPNTGVFSAKVVALDTPVTVRATYTHPESGTIIFKDYVITVLGDASIKLLQSIAINGPSQFLKTETGTYTVTANYSDGSSADVTPNSFTSSNAAAGTFANGVLTPPNNMIRDKSTTLNASYTENGITKTAQLPVTVKDPVVYPDTVVINGSANVNQDSTSQYVAHVTYSDGTQADVTASWSMEATTYATIGAATGLLTAKPLTAPGNKTAKVRVSYTSNGQTVTGEKTITIVDNMVWPVSAAITGNTTVAPNGTSQFTYTVTYSDGSTAQKTPTWSLSDNTMGTIDVNGLYTAGANPGQVTVRATYSELAINLNATKAVTVSQPSADIRPMRWASAMFNRSDTWTGGPMTPTQEEIDNGMDGSVAPNGTAYEHWTGLKDFLDSEFTNTFDLAIGETKVFNATMTFDHYIYLLVDAQVSDITIVNNNNQFPEEWNAIGWRNDWFDNFPPSEVPNPPKFITVQWDDGTGMRDWKLYRRGATATTANSPLTIPYKFTYVQ